MTGNFKRKDALSLPEVSELEFIMEREAKRPVAPGKEKMHFADFALAIQWLDIIGLPTDIFTKPLTWQELVALGREVQPQVISGTLQKAREGDKDFENLMEEIANYLGEEDVPQVSDLIFVFGSKSLSRIETAVALYQEELAQNIFITGGAPVYEESEKSEASIFHDWAIEHGVPSGRVFVHDTAITVADNVRGGLNTIDVLNLSYHSMILVTAWFAMRRSWAIIMKYVSRDTTLYRINASVTATSDLAPHEWWKNERGIATIFNEFAKLRISEALNSS